MIAFALTALLILIALAVPIAAAMGVLGMLLDKTYGFLPLSGAAGEVAWNATTDFLLVALPLFILLGEILLRAGFAERMYGALARWLNWLPGGLMHSNIAACAIFSATSGSSLATAATVGAVALPQAERFGYGQRLFLGSLAAGGTLGILIPPSINMIIFAVLTNTSVPRLYLAGIIPGLMLAALFMLVILVACVIWPAQGGRNITSTWSERLQGLVHLLPPLFIFIVVVGSIYAGIATPTESASLGVLAALALAAAFGKLNVRMLMGALESTMRSTGMIMLIIVAAYFLNFVMTSIGLTTALTDVVTNLGLTKWETLLAVIVFYLILGCFMETLSLMITTIPIMTPIMVAAGFDPLWFGILVILLVETALITPPVGLNLFVVQNVRKHGSLNDVMLGALPFVLSLLAMMALLALFPGLALWLPSLW